MAARRLPVRLWRALSRRARQMSCVLLAALVPVATPVLASDGVIVAARYAEPTTRYPHAVLGDDIEYGALILTQEGGKQTVLRLPEERVFEDTEPRLVDVTGDGRAEVVVVESHQSSGARLAVYTDQGLLAATPYIGQRNRWLAPIAIADLDGDGAMELAYIDRPHLAKTLRVWRYAAGNLTQITAMEGLTNHLIGERDIGGGLRDCGTGPEMVVASADWRRLIGVTFDGSTLAARDIGPHRDRSSFANALKCQ